MLYQCRHNLRVHSSYTRHLNRYYSEVRTPVPSCRGCISIFASAVFTVREDTVLCVSALRTFYPYPSSGVGFLAPTIVVTLTPYCCLLIITVILKRHKLTSFQKAHNTLTTRPIISSTVSSPAYQLGAIHPCCLTAL